VPLQDVYAPQCVLYRRIVPITEVGMRCTKVAGSFVGPVAFGASGTAPFTVLFLTTIVSTHSVSHAHNRVTSEAIVGAFESFAPRRASSQAEIVVATTPTGATT